jgi:succinoglycan biosynthesis protein ExoM
MTTAEQIKKSSISICICTRKRSRELANLLRSFERMTVPQGIEVNVIVVENDTENFSESTVREIAAESKFEIKYFLETKRGIVHARNKSIREAGIRDFCCFTDDDEYVPTDWLTELLRCQAEFNADGVAGPTHPVFKKKVPDYIRDFHLPDTFEYGTIVTSAYTGCLLMRKKYLDMVKGPFDERLNFTGGEDINLTYNISMLGGVIRFNPDAKAFEDFPENRLTVKYIIKRTFRNSNTGLYARYLRNPSGFKMQVFPRLVLRFCKGVLIFIPYYIAGGKNKLKGIIKIVNAIGGFYFLFGMKNRFYQ